MQKKALEHFKAMSLRDELTGLLNRRGFLASAEELWHLARRENRPFLLVFADLDGLKLINDQWGHQEGDWALRETAAVLRSVFRKSDLIARMGGDEFTVFAFDVDHHELSSIRRRVRTRLEAVNAASGKPFTLSLSLGGAPKTGQTPQSIDELLSGADQQLYEQKLARNPQRTVPSE
jgi:diguanylate cyclase (GGDEF)-like protein